MIYLMVDHGSKQQVHLQNHGQIYIMVMKQLIKHKKRGQTLNIQIKKEEIVQVKLMKNMMVLMKI